MIVDNIGIEAVGVARLRCARRGVAACVTTSVTTTMLVDRPFFYQQRLVWATGCAPKATTAARPCCIHSLSVDQDTTAGGRRVETGERWRVETELRRVDRGADLGLCHSIPTSSARA